jgi:hypothetical protein
LYRSLFALLTLQGLYHAYAGITLPNPASVGLHESLGFQPVGVYRAVGYQRLRSSPQPLQGWESYGATSETELSLDFIGAKLSIMPFPLQHTKSNQATCDMMQLSPLGPGLTARQAELVLTDADHFLNLRADAIQPPHLHHRQRQAIGGVVLLAVSDNQHFEAPVQPAALGPVGVPPVVTDRLPIDATILFEATDKISPIIPNPLQEGFGRIPSVEEHILGPTAQAIARIAE